MIGGVASIEDVDRAWMGIFKADRPFWHDGSDRFGHDPKNYDPLGESAE